jgi:hypothetical protein
VRRCGRATIPETTIVNVVNVGAVKHDLNEDNNHNHDTGNVCTGSINDQPFAGA